MHRVSPTVDTAAYASGDLIGGKLTIDAPKNGIIVSVSLVDQAAQSAAIDLLLWAADPAATTFTDNAALDVADADLDNAIGVIPIAAADYDNLSDNRIATVPNAQVAYEILGVGQNGQYNLYAALVSRGTPTYVAGTDVQLTLGILSWS